LGIISVDRNVSLRDMKYTLRIAMPEQYCYIETEFEGDASEAMHEYRNLVKLANGGFGLEQKEWNRVLDVYLADGSMSVEDGEQMSKEQAWLIKEVDKSANRLKYRNVPKDKVHHSLT